MSKIKEIWEESKHIYGACVKMAFVQLLKPYFVGFDSFVESNIFASVLNSEKAQQLLSSITFSDAKRPYTKDVLKRIDVVSILKSMSIDEINETSFENVREVDVANFINKYDNDLSLFQ